MRKIKGVAVGIVVLFVLSFVIPVNLMAGANPSGKNDSDSRKAAVVVPSTGGAGAAAGTKATAGVTAGTVAAGVVVTAAVIAVVANATKGSDTTTAHH